MIYDTLSALERYLGANPLLDKAIDFIQKNDLTALSAGKTELAGERLYVNRFSYDTADPQSLVYETHRLYADLHLLLQGEECIWLGCHSTSVNDAYDAENDCILTKGERAASCVLRSGCFALYYPQEAHMPKVSLHNACHVDKLVFKIRVEA